MPSLLTYNTNLKSLKYGKDTPGGGSSKQPYIRTPIPATDEPRSGVDLSTGDGLVRGGIGAPIDAAEDVVRLGKYFTDFSGVSGPLFAAKQNILSRISPATQASGRINWKKAALNEGVYTPLSTLAQAGINFIGGHVDKQGVNPITGVRTYTDVIQSVIGEPNGEGNRLVNLYNEHAGRFSSTNIFSYSGGPGSNLGIGKTNIRFATDNTGAISKVLGNEFYTESYIQNQTGLKGSDTDRAGITDEFRAPWGATKQFAKIANGKIENFDNPNNSNQFFFLDGADLDFISSEDGVTWDNVIKNTTISPYTKPTVLASSKPDYTGGNSSDQYISPFGATAKYISITSGSVVENVSQINWTDEDGNLQGVFEKGQTTWNQIRSNTTVNPYTRQIFTSGSNQDLSSKFNSPLGATAKYVELVNFQSKIEDTGTNIVWYDKNGLPIGNLLKNSVTWDNILTNTTINPYSLDRFIAPSSLPNGGNLDLSSQFIYPTGSTDYSTLLNTPVNNDIDSSNGETWKFQNIQTSVYNPNTLNSSDRIKDQNTKVLTQEQLTTISKETKDNKDNPGSKIVNYQHTINSLAPSYTGKGVIENEAGQNINSYRSPGLKSSQGKVIDRVNAQPIYRSTAADTENFTGGNFVEDLIPFRIGAINSNTDLMSTGKEFEKDYIHFRAYIDSFSDSYTGEWNSTKYMGRGEKVFNYTGFDRKINLSFTVAAQSKQELLNQYKKLNFLVSNLAPDYTDAGYMNGPLVTLTMGGWCFELPGFIESMTLDIPEESPWEIALKNNGERDILTSQLPHIVRVTGFSFQPLEEFRVRKQNLKFDNQGKVDYNESEFQHYISLATPGGAFGYSINPDLS